MALSSQRANDAFYHDLDKMDDIDIFDDEGEVLLDLDWQRSSLGRRYVCCGLDCSWLVKTLPCNPFVPPEWWYRLSRKQRRCCQGSTACLVALLVMVVLVSVIASVRSALSMHGSAMDSGKLNDQETIWSGCVWDDPEPPSWMKPLAYRLDFDLDFEEPFSMKGTSEMDVHLLDKSKCLVLHKKPEVSINKVWLPGSGEKGRVLSNNSSSFFLLEFQRTIPSSIVTVALSFKVKIHRKPVGGVQILDMKGSNGEKQLVLRTSFSGSHMFPCIDNRTARATFASNMSLPQGLTLLSNMPVKESNMLSGGKTKYVFETTPPLIAHTNSFLAGNMDGVNGTADLRRGSMPVKVWGWQRVEELRLALERAVSYLLFYELFLDMDAPVQKVDYVVLGLEPHGAEDFGLIHIGESGLSFNPVLTDAFRLRRLNEIVAHETSHFWFAEIVGVDAPKNIFLQEALATYMQYIAPESTIPGVGGFDRFYAENLLPALWTEGGLVTHPLSFDGESHYVVEIRYNKGTSLLRMLRTYFLRGNDSPSILTIDQPVKDPIRDGLKSVLKKFEYDSPGISEFWATLGESAGEPLDEYMARWTYEPGAPIVHVKLKGRSQVVVEQSPLSGGECTKETAWWIPIRYKKKTSAESEWMVLDSCGPVNLTSLASKNDTILLNYEGFGYYHTHYHWDNVDTILSEDTNLTVSSTDLTVLLADSFAMSQIGKYDIDVFLDLTAALGTRLEVSWSAWHVALHNLGKLRNLMRNGDWGCLDELSSYVRSTLTGPILDKISDFEVADDDSMDLRLMRSTVLLAAGEFNDMDRIDKALSLFSGNQSIHADIKDMVYRMAVAHGNSSTFGNIFSRAIEETQVHEKIRLFNALFYTRNKEDLKKIWDFVLQNPGQPMNVRAIMELLQVTRGMPTDQLFDLSVSALASSPSSWLPFVLVETSRYITKDERLLSLKEAMENELNPSAWLLDVARIVQRNRNWMETSAQRVCTWLNN